MEVAARLALEKGDDLLLDRIFSYEQTLIREHDTSLVEIWTEREIRRLSGKGVPRAEAEKRVRSAMADGSLVPPKEIDFRMHTRS